MSCTPRRGWILGLTCAVLSSVWFAGCGDTATPVGPVDNTGRIAVDVTWPAVPGKLIPANTTILRIEVSGNTNGLSAPAVQTMTPGVTRATFVGLIPGSYRVTASAYAPNDFGGISLVATGAFASAVVTAGNTTTVNITLISEVASVTVALLPSTTDDVAAHRVVATLTAWSGPNGTGSIVPIASTKVGWVSGTPAVATVPGAPDNAIWVTPVTNSAATGTKLVNITGRYLELPVDLSASAILTVNRAATTGGINVNVN